MDAIKATWTNGQILPSEPVGWPEGTQLVVEPAPESFEPIGLDESQWRDDATALAEWEAWLGTLEPRILSDEERAALAAYEQAHRRFNLEAVRRQMAAGEAP